MAGLDGDGFLVALRRRLRERPTWGLPQLRELLEELELEHTPDESADAAVLRRFASGLTDEFMGRLPRTGSTDDAIVSDDPSGDAGATAAGEHHPMTAGGHDGTHYRTPAPAGR